MGTANVVKPAPDTGIGQKGVTSFWVILFCIWLAAETLLFLYAVMVFWPDTTPAVAAQASSPTTAVPKTFEFLGRSVAMTRDQNVLLIVALLGGLGAMGHVVRSFFKYVGERNLIWSWMPQYFLIPVVGAILSVITYIVLRAGLLGGSASGAEGNIWGFAAVAALVGLFTAQAATKLRTIFEAVLAPSSKGSEPLASTAPPPFGFRPKQAQVGATVQITGEGIETSTAIVFGGPAEAAATWVADQKALQVTVPPDAKTGPLTVKLAAGDLTSVDDFTVLP